MQFPEDVRPPTALYVITSGGQTGIPAALAISFKAAIDGLAKSTISCTYRIRRNHIAEVGDDNHVRIEQNRPIKRAVLEVFELCNFVAIFPIAESLNIVQMASQFGKNSLLLVL